MTLSFFSAFGGPNSLMMTLSFIKFFSLRPLSTEAIDDGTLVLFGFRRPEFVDDDTLVLQSFSASCLVLSIIRLIFVQHRSSSSPNSSAHSRISGPFIRASLLVPPAVWEYRIE
jgi:hypothetical protein